jgi:long-chain acyl-CoA synthetase
VTLLYTSGTTGNPKGVLLTHRNVLYEVAAAVSTGAVAPGVRWVSYLPLAHIAERMFSIYLAVATAGHVHFCPQPTELIRVVGAVKPTSFFGVPRVWEKVRAGIQALLTAEQDEGRRQVRRPGHGRRAAIHREQAVRPQHPAALAEEFARADQAVLGPIRSLLGLGEASVVSSAAAPLPPDVGSFFAGLGLAILDIYGMTETTGAVTSNTPDGFKLGTVGRVFPVWRPGSPRTARSASAARSPPRATSTCPSRPRPSSTADGWLHTGDIGSIDEDGFLSCGRPQEGTDHHLRGGEHLAGRDREPARGASAHRAGAGLR